MNEGLLINSEVFGRNFSLLDVKSLIDASPRLWSERALVHTHVRLLIDVQQMCIATCPCACEFVLAHVDVCVQYVEVEHVQSKVLSSLFEGSSNGL